MNEIETKDGEGLTHERAPTFHSRFIIHFGIFAVFVVLAELLSYLIVEFFVMEKAAFLLYTPPQIDETAYKSYLAIRDPILGWPTADALNSDRYDKSGSRPIPAFPTAGQECVTLYGDSFTYGSDVSDEEAWGNLLAGQIGCRVGNFGVGGYGTDQALLRFQTNAMDGATVSILGIHPHAIMRNVTQYFYLLAPQKVLSLAFKPRFISEGDSVRLIDLPSPNFSELHLLEGQVSQLLPYETFVPGNGIGPVPKRFPYLLVVINLLLHEKVQNWLSDLPSWKNFLAAEHPSKANQVTLGIIKQFFDECRKRDKKCLVIFFTTPSSYEYYLKSGQVAIRDLSSELDKMNLPYIALTPHIAKRLGQRSICEILSNTEGCTGHLNAEGNRIIADIVEDYIVLNALR